jgi:hypothetical protein
MFRAAKSIDFGQCELLLGKERPQLMTQLIRETGFSEDQLNQTVVMGAPPAGEVWALAFSAAEARTQAALGQFAVNWPNEVPIVVRQTADAQFRHEVEAAFTAASVPQLMRAAAKTIAQASAHASDTSGYVQVGVTAPAWMSKSLYIESEASVLLSMSDSDVRGAAKPAV